MTPNGERTCGLHLRVWSANKQSLWTVNGGSRKSLVPPLGQLHSRSPGKRLRPTVFLSPHNKPLLLFPGKPSPRRPGCRSNTHGLVWCVVSTIKVGQLGTREQVNSTGQNQHSGPGTAHRCGEAQRGGDWEVEAQEGDVLKSPGTALRFCALGQNELHLQQS